jgi:hypothetical protein
MALPTDKHHSPKELERAREFMQKLKTLCDEYDASIEGCGCCDSPSGYVGKVYYGHLEINQKNFLCSISEVVV